MLLCLKMDLIILHIEIMNNLSNLGEFTIGYKYCSNIKDRPQLHSTKDAFQVLKMIYDTDRLGIQEQFVVVFLNNSNIVIGCCNLFTGSLNSTTVDLRLIIASALKLMATGIIISHNHPSGKMKASESDILLTRRLKQALALIDIILIDHIIISPFDEYLSLKEDGIF